jgi:hypothetical protein
VSTLFIWLCIGFLLAYVIYVLAFNENEKERLRNKKHNKGGMEDDLDDYRTSRRVARYDRHHYDKKKLNKKL